MLRKQLVKDLPVSNQEIERLVKAASQEIDVKGNPLGFYNQTIEVIANATFLNRGGDFWLIWDDETKEALGYAICSISKDIDNQLTYWGTQAYADKRIRHKSIIKELWNDIEEFAKQRFCKHFVMVSSRETKAYQKFLGNEWHEYAVLLKKEI